MNLPSSLEDFKLKSQNDSMQQVEEPVNILAHIDPEEIPYLNEMQGREIIDPETGLRDYTLLSSILQFPEAQQGLSEAEQIYKAKKMAEGGFVGEEDMEHGRPIVPELEELRRAGRGGDTELIIITPELAEIFASLKGTKVKTNPQTGFPEYGFFKEIFRIGAPIIGAVLGGPIGAFAGSVAANKATGKSWGDSLKQGVLAGGLTFAAPMAGGAFQTAFPGLSSSLGGATRGLLGSNMGGALGSLFTPGSGSGMFSILGGGASSVPGSSVGRMLPASAFGGGASGGMSAAAGTGGGILSNLGGAGKLLPLAGAGLMYMKGRKEEQKALSDYDSKQKQDLEDLRNRTGFYSKLGNIKPLNREISGDYSGEGEHSFYKPYDLGKIEYKSMGGPIRGRGKGQQDNIPKDIRENSYIIDASTVSDLGDGSSDAGIEELNHFFSKVKSHPSHKKGGFIPALVSNGEYEISPDKVNALGKGSNAKGAKMLKGMVQNIRRTKRTSGYKLPPKAKPLGGYLKKLKVS